MKKVTMIHPATNHSVDAAQGFSLSCLILGPFWFAWKRMSGAAWLAGAWVIVTLLYGWFVLPFIANPLQRRYLRKRGYIEAPSSSATAAAPDTPDVPASELSEAVLQEHQAAVREMMAEIAPLAVDPGTCMACRAGGKLEAVSFAFARPVIDGEMRTFKMGGLSAASALAGGPFRYTTGWRAATVLPTELMLCEPCLKQRKNFVGLTRLTEHDYALHPWAAAARRHRFTRYMDEISLRNYGAAVQKAQSARAADAAGKRAG